jgi:pimeloyl-ACP methyl ester carboxylesterase
MQLAQALANAFTVYLPDRRGHNLPGPFRKDYRMQKEVDDVDALLTQTGTHNVFGVSSGGIICLQSALTLPAVHKVALYEPALIVNGSISMAFLPRYNREITQGKMAAALVTAMQGAQLGPAIFNVIPRPLLEFLTTRAMQSENKTARPGDVTMRILAPTLHYDFELVAEMAETLETFKAVRAEVLLLGGSKSPVWLKAALDALMTVLPHVKRVEFPGLDHGASSDPSSTNRGGQPAVVAQELRRFFAGPRVYQGAIGLWFRRANLARRNRAIRIHL